MSKALILTFRDRAIGAERSEGTFALFRPDGNRIQVLTDYAGSRTIWYVATPELFAAATSQRMLVAVLGSFDFNFLSVKWLLAAGDKIQTLNCAEFRNGASLSRRLPDLKAVRKHEPGKLSSASAGTSRSVKIAARGFFHSRPAPVFSHFRAGISGTVGNFFMDSGVSRKSSGYLSGFRFSSGSVERHVYRHVLQT